jgi:phytoene desaturase
MSKHVIVIGGGVGGLAAAIRLGAAGHRVTLLEKNPTVGGKLNQWVVLHPHRPADRPFRFDTGPSLLTMPFVFEELFKAAGESLADHLTLQRLDPIARYRWGDGTTFEARSGSDELLKEVARIAPGDVEGWKRLAARGKMIWELSAELFLYHAPEQIFGKGISLSNALSAIAVPIRIGMFSNFARTVNRHLHHPKMREVLYQYATYSGASPFHAPATLAVIPHAEFGFGGWYLNGGLYRLAEELAKLAQRVGVDIQTNSPVKQIVVERSSGTKPCVKGVVLASGERLTADAVVANSDVVYTYRHLIDAAYRRRYQDTTLNKIEAGGSGMVLMLGIEGSYPQLAHHNKFMPRDYRSDLTAMFDTHTVPDDPCIYVCASTRTDPTQAPDGCENLFILASAPPLDGTIDWTTEGPRYRDQLIQTLERKWGLTDLSKRIVVERCMTPLDLQTAYNANAGSIYGIGSNSRRTAFLRPPNRDKEISGLYFCGGATHPGGGLPLVTLSGKIVSELVAEDFAGKPMPR